MRIRLHHQSDEGLSAIDVEVVGSDVHVRRGPAHDRLGQPEVTALASPAEAAAHAEALAGRLREDGAAPVFEQDPALARFYADELEPLLARHFHVELDGGGRPGVLGAMEQQHGLPLPPELRAHYRLRERAALGWCRFGEWRIWDEDAFVVDGEENRLEQLIRWDQRHSLGIALSEALAAMVPIGTTSTGDVYLAGLDLSCVDNTEVFLWDHDSGSLDVIAESMAALAELNRLYAIRRGIIPVDGDPLDIVGAGLGRLARRAAPSWHYRDLVESAEVAPSYEATTATRSLYYRGQWLDQLLRHGNEAAVQGAAEWLRVDALVQWHLRSPWAALRDSPAILLPSRAIYWSLYHFWLGRDAELRECLDRIQTSPWPLARDAAALVDQLAGGRNVLGAIRDVQALRARFQAEELGPLVSAP